MSNSTEIDVLRSEIKALREDIKEICECVDMFYDDSYPRRIHPELKKYSGTIHVLDKMSHEALMRSARFEE